LKEYGNIYFTKTIKMTAKGSLNLLYYLHRDNAAMTTIDKIKEKMNEIGCNKEENLFKIIVFESMKKINFHDQFKDICISKHFWQSIEYGKIFFHSPSLDFFNHQFLKRYLNFKSSKKNFNSYYNWLTQNIHSLDQERFIVTSGPLYIYGIRDLEDIDALSVKIEHPSITPQFEKIFNQYLWNHKTKFSFVDFGLQGTNMWKEKWTIGNNIIYKLINTEDVFDFIFNPQNFIYFHGMKFCNLQYDVARRLLRMKSRDFVDIMALNQLLNIPVPKYVQEMPKYMELKSSITKTLMEEYIKQKYLDILNPSKLDEYIKIFFMFNQFIKNFFLND
jgi:hypothetical protein